jgi:hypothetical protein
LLVKLCWFSLKILVVGEVVEQKFTLDRAQILIVQKMFSNCKKTTTKVHARGYLHFYLSDKYA